MKRDPKLEAKHYEEADFQAQRARMISGDASPEEIEIVAARLRQIKREIAELEGRNA
jgi:hypothetical protein